jgi:hypothetical protein
VPPQPVDATPSAVNLFSKGGVDDATETGEAFPDPADRHVEPLQFQKAHIVCLILVGTQKSVDERLDVAAHGDYREP